MQSNNRKQQPHLKQNKTIGDFIQRSSVFFTDVRYLKTQFRIWLHLDILYPQHPLNSDHSSVFHCLTYLKNLSLKFCGSFLSLGLYDIFSWLDWHLCTVMPYWKEYQRWLDFASSHQVVHHDNMFSYWYYLSIVVSTRFIHCLVSTAILVIGEKILQESSFKSMQISCFLVKLWPFFSICWYSLPVAITAEVIFYSPHFFHIH